MPRRNADEGLDRLFDELWRMVEPFGPAVVDGMVRDGGGPFKVLIATLLSLRTKDEVTGPATERLFKLASDSETMSRLAEEDIARAVYPVGFYKTKAATIVRICRTLVEKHGGRVPDDMDDLLALKGVGRKTANLVLSVGFGVDAICVDTHVHRICNRWGYVETSSPELTETALRRKLPRKWWKVINGLLVTFGQNVCKPISPFCSKCSLASWWCERRGVDRCR